MARRKKITPPARRETAEAWGDVPADSTDECARLAEIVIRNGRKITNFQQFEHDLRDSSHAANWGLYEKTRLNPTARKETRKAIEELAGKLSEALAALRNLGPDAADQYERVAAKQVTNDADNVINWNRLEPRGIPNGSLRVEGLRQLLSHGDAWASGTLEHFPKLPKNRPKEDVGHALTRALLNIWRDQTGKNPAGTYNNDFVEFVSAVAKPIWNNRSAGTPHPDILGRQCIVP